MDSDNVVAIIVGSDNLVTPFGGDTISKGVAVISGTANSSDWYAKGGLRDRHRCPLERPGVSGRGGQAVRQGNQVRQSVLRGGRCLPQEGPLPAYAAKAGTGFTSLAVSSTAPSYTAPSYTAPSYTAQCVQRQQQKVDYAQLDFASAAAAKFVQDCQAQGYNPIWGSSEQAIGKDLLGVPNLTLFGPAYAFPSAATAPPVQTFVKAMTKYATGSNWREGTASFTWTGLEVLRKALATAGTDPTRRDVTNGRNSLTARILVASWPTSPPSPPASRFPSAGIRATSSSRSRTGKTVALANLTPSGVS